MPDGTKYQTCPSSGQPGMWTTLHAEVLPLSAVGGISSISLPLRVVFTRFINLRANATIIYIHDGDISLEDRHRFMHPRHPLLEQYPGRTMFVGNPHSSNQIILVVHLAHSAQQ